MLNLGYLGGVYDAGTGLIYMGNGQYYDPYTRRFLNRGGESQSDPYAPWSNNVASMLISPLALLAMVFGRKKKRTKIDNGIIILVLGLTLSTSMFVVAENYLPSVYANADESLIGIPFQPPRPEDIDFPENTPGAVIEAVSRVVESIGKDVINCYIYNSKYIDPALEPEYVKWSPSVNFLDFLPDVGLTQNYLDLDRDGEFSKTNSIFAWGPNICGQVSLSNITWALTGQTYNVNDMLITANEIKGHPPVTLKDGRVFNVTNFVHTTSSGDLAKILIYNNYKHHADTYMGVRTHNYSDIRRWYLDLKNSTFLELENANGALDIRFESYYDSPFGTLTNADFAKSGSTYPNLLRSTLGSGHYFIQLTNIDGSGYFTTPENRYGGHWVVITGFSDSDNWDDPQSETNWIRLYNPYFNRPEYYRWSEFVTYMDIGIGVEIWKEDF